MKQKLLFPLVLMILSCGQNQKKDQLLGIWDIESATDIETGEIELIEKGFVEFKSDSLYLITDLDSDLAYAWGIEGDSIILNELGSVYIKEFTAENLTVEYYFWDKVRLSLKKRE